MTRPHIAVLSLVLAVGLAAPLLPRGAAAQAAAQPGYGEIVAGEQAANARRGPRLLRAHVIPVPSDEVSPQIQALTPAPSPPHMNADPKSADEWKELINRRAA